MADAARMDWESGSSACFGFDARGALGEMALHINSSIDIADDKLALPAPVQITRQVCTNAHEV
jgi:hypothetical protein